MRDYVFRTSRPKSHTNCIPHALWHIELNGIAMGEKIKASDLEAWFKKVDRLRALAKGFSDADALNELDNQIELMNLMYRTLTGDNSPTINKGERSYREHCGCRI